MTTDQLSCTIPQMPAPAPEYVRWVPPPTWILDRPSYSISEIVGMAGEPERVIRDIFRRKPARKADPVVGEDRISLERLIRALQNNGIMQYTVA
jgi:hypothetical protein